MAKYLLIAAIVISLVTAGIGFKNYQTLTDTRANLDAKTTTLTATEGKLAKTATDLKTAAATLEAAEAEKVKTAADLVTAQSDLTAKTTALDEATQKLTASETKATELQEKLDKIASSDPTNPNPTNDPTQVIDQLNQQIQEKDAQIASFQEKAAADKAKLDALIAKEEARQNQQIKNGLEGRVLAVNPAWNFVVLSIGDKQGVVNNAELLLKRGGQYLGKVRITSVEPSTSIADIVANTMPAGVAVQPGDSVIYQSVTE